MPEATAPIDPTTVDAMTIEDIMRLAEKLELDDKKNSPIRKVGQFLRRHQTALLVATSVSLALAYAAEKIDKDDVIDAIESTTE